MWDLKLESETGSGSEPVFTSIDVVYETVVT